MLTVVYGTIDIRYKYIMSDVAMHNGAAALRESALVPALGQRSVVLVGMMGAGKSSIGRRLATRLGIPFVDADTDVSGSKLKGLQQTLVSVPLLEVLIDDGPFQKAESGSHDWKLATAGNHRFRHDGRPRRRAANHSVASQQVVASLFNKRAEIGLRQPVLISTHEPDGVRVL